MREGVIKDLCIVIVGQSPEGTFYNTDGEGIEFHQGKKSFGDMLLQPSNVWTTKLTKLAEPLDILMSVRAPVGPTNITDRQVCIGRGLAAIRCKDNALNKYVYYALKNIETKITGNDGAVFNSINKKQIEELPVRIASLSEQQRIVEQLDAEFAKIDAIKQNAEKQLQWAKDLFQSALKDLLTPKEGWIGRFITEISQNLDSKRIPITQNKRIAGIYPYYGASGIVDYVNDYIFDDTLLLISEDGANLLARTTPIAFSITGKNWVNNHAHVLKFNDDYLRRYVEYYFANLNISDLITGAAQPKLTQGALNTIKILYPMESVELQNIVLNLDNLFEKVKLLQSNYEQTITLCNDLKQSILKDIFG